MIQNVLPNFPRCIRGIFRRKLGYEIRQMSGLGRAFEKLINDGLILVGFRINDKNHGFSASQHFLGLGPIPADDRIEIRNIGQNQPSRCRVVFLIVGVEQLIPGSLRILEHFNIRQRQHRMARKQPGNINDTLQRRRNGHGAIMRHGPTPFSGGHVDCCQELEKGTFPCAARAEQNANQTDPAFMDQNLTRLVLQIRPAGQIVRQSRISPHGMGNF
ncbi:hypothetical protein [Desulfonatronum thiosulfatophilum]|uniref:hypothetical protein n=1 Tax=Desulfonatronum thiosulfatophilum TaxID=617002 RepID=UPI003CC50670